MQKLVLRRASQGDDGTFGELLDNGFRIAVTCERPPGDNKPMSCIPVGSYGVVQFVSPSKGDVFLLHEVPGRSMIEIHAGNTIADTEGCILVGRTVGQLNGVKAVLDSRKTLATLLERYTQPFNLIVMEDF